MGVEVEVDEEKARGTSMNDALTSAGGTTEAKRDFCDGMSARNRAEVDDEEEEADEVDLMTLFAVAADDDDRR